MRLLYVANVRMPTEKAHGVQIMKMCEAFAKRGELSGLLVPKRRTHIKVSPFEYYGIHAEFPIEFLPTIDAVQWGPLGFLVQTYTFTRSLKKAVQGFPDAVIYGRDERVLWEIAKSVDSDRMIVWETHTGAWNGIARRVAARATRIIAISQGLKDFYIMHGVPAQKILVAHDAIDLASFVPTETKEQSRTRLTLPLDKKIALYIGRVDGWKGVDTFCEAAALLPETIQAVVIGGESAQIAELQKKYPRMRFLGFHPYTELANNQIAADALVLPNTGTNEISAKFTSPLKLFSYMSSGTPIVTSDLPSIREVLDDSCAYFATPDDADSFARVIQESLSDENASTKAEAARARVQRYTWDARAEAITQFL